LLAPESRKAHGSAQLPELRTLLASDRESLVEGLLRSGFSTPPPAAIFILPEVYGFEQE
jgi:hypothetical protein